MRNSGGHAILKRIILIMFLSFMCSGVASAQDVKIRGCGLNNNKIYVKANIKGHKITVRTPKISGNKILKLVNVAL